MKKREPIKIKKVSEMTPEETKRLYDSLMQKVDDYQPTLWESFINLAYSAKRIVRGTIGWASFLGLFAVTGSVEQETISLGVAVVLLPILGGALIWSIESLRKDIQ